MALYLGDYEELRKAYAQRVAQRQQQAYDRTNLLLAGDMYPQNPAAAASGINVGPRTYAQGDVVDPTIYQSSSSDKPAMRISPYATVKPEDQSFLSIQEARAALDAAGGRGGIRRVSENGPYSIIVSRGADRYTPASTPGPIQSQRIDMTDSGFQGFRNDPMGAYKRAGPAIQRLASEMGNQGPRKLDTSDQDTQNRLGIDRRTWRGMSAGQRAEAILATKRLAAEMENSANTIAWDAMKYAAEENHKEIMAARQQAHEEKLKIWEIGAGWKHARQKNLDEKDMERIKAANAQELEKLRSGYDMKKTVYERDAIAKIAQANREGEDEKVARESALSAVRTLSLIAKDISSLSDDGKVAYMQTMGAKNENQARNILMALQAFINQ